MKNTWDIKEFNELLEECKATSKTDIKIAVDRINRKYNYWVELDSLVGLVSECLEKSRNCMVDEEKVYGEMRQSLSAILDEINKTIEKHPLPF